MKKLPGLRAIDFFSVKISEHAMHPEIETQMKRDHLPPIREQREEVPQLDRKQIIVRFYVSGVVKSFDRKAA